MWRKWCGARSALGKLCARLHAIHIHPVASRVMRASASFDNAEMSWFMKGCLHALAKDARIHRIGRLPGCWLPLTFVAGGRGICWGCSPCLASPAAGSGSRRLRAAPAACLPGYSRFCCADRAHSCSNLQQSRCPSHHPRPMEFLKKDPGNIVKQRQLRPAHTFWPRPPACPAAGPGMSPARWHRASGSQSEPAGVQGRGLECCN